LSAVLAAALITPLVFLPRETAPPTAEALRFLGEIIGYAVGIGGLAGFIGEKIGPKRTGVKPQSHS
jgi:hypothetical protein